MDLYKFSVCLPALVNCLKDYEGEHAAQLEAAFIGKLDECVADLSQLEAMVEQTVDMDAIDRHEYLVNPAFDPRLADLKRQRDRLASGIESLLEEVADNLGLDTTKVPFPAFC